VLFLVLALVLGALGLLITALITAQSLWAWISIGVSALAGLVLVVDVVRRRARRAAGETAKPARKQETTVAPLTRPLPGNGEAADIPEAEESASGDLAVVAELDEEVLVVDEQPRYHVAGCSWLADHDTIAISVREARALGFTPCGRCTPDAQLAAGHRAST
jgi:hypothetical protein